MSLIFAEGQNFYPCHPSPEKTHQIQSSPSPMLEGQTAPFQAAWLRKAFDLDPEGSLAAYVDKRFDVAGVVIWVGLDPHNLPTVQLSHETGGPCCAHCIFPSEEILQQVKPGDRVAIRANYLVLSRRFGVVMKFSELLTSENAACAGF